MRISTRILATAAVAALSGGTALLGAGSASASTSPQDVILCSYVVTGSNVKIHTSPSASSGAYGLTQQGDTASAQQNIQNQYIYADWPDSNGRRWNGWVSTSYAHATSCHRAG